MENQQIIVEHIVNIDTVAQHIGTVNAVAAVAGQIAAVAGMLPDVAATAQSRAIILSLSKKLTEIKAVADALPLLSALQGMTEQVTAVISLRPEMAAVVGQMSAIQRLAAELDTLVQAPEYAAAARVDADLAEVASGQAEGFAGKADAARLGAEFAENEAKAARDISTTARDEAESSRDEARKAADAAAAVSGLPDASLASPGDPLIWSGTAFAVGKLAESLLNAEGTLAVAPAVLTSITTAQAEAASALVTAGQARTTATEAQTTAEGVNAKATQALTDAQSAKAVAEAFETLAGSFDARIHATETETTNVGLGLGTHAGNTDVHTPRADIEAVAEAAVSRLKDGGDGSTLPADRATLLALSQLMDAARAELSAFLDGTDPGQRLAILAELDRLSAESGNTLTRADVVNDLTTGGQDVPLSAAQGQKLKLQLDGVRSQAEAAVRPWVTVVRELPAAWPETTQGAGLLLLFPLPEADAAHIANPGWYTNVRGVPTELVLNASGIRLTDGTTVQSAVGQIKIDATEARTAAQTASTAATEAKADATSAKADASAALAKTSTLATQTTPGLVKGSDTVTVGPDGSLTVTGGGTGGGSSAVFVGQWVFLRQNHLPAGYLELNGTLYTGAAAKFPDLMPYLSTHPDECTTEADWQARSAAASGTGGVPFYVYDSTADTLRMPDTRGDSPYHGTPGTWQGDAIRNLTGTIMHKSNASVEIGYYDHSSGTGVLTLLDGVITHGYAGSTSKNYSTKRIAINASLAVPTDTTNHPRRIGMTFCVYAGTIGA